MPKATINPPPAKGVAGIPLSQIKKAADKRRASHGDSARPASGKGKGKGKGRGRGSNVVQDPLVQQTYPQIRAAAHQAGQVAYGPQQHQLGQQAANIPPWFQQYKNGVMAQQQNLPAQYAPVQAQAQQTAQATGQPVLQGVDPKSEAAQNDVLAAASRKVLADSFVSLVQQQQMAQADYYGARQQVANAAQISAQTQNAKDRQQVAQQRGAYEQTQVQQGIGRERDYGLAVQHQNAENKAFNLDVAKAGADVKTDRLKIKTDAQAKRDKLKADAKARTDKANAEGKTVNSYGYTSDQWSRFSPAHRKRIIFDFKNSGGSGGSGSGKPGGPTLAQQRMEKKRVAAVREKSGKALSRVNDVISDWNRLRNSRVTTGEKDDNGKPLTRPITPNDIRGQLRSQGYSADEIHLALMIRAGKTFTKDDVQAAHRLGIRIPRKYLPKKRKDKPGVPSGGVQTAPGANGQYRPG